MHPISSLPRSAKLLIATLPLFALTAGQGSSGQLHIAVDNVRAHTGRVHVDLCTQAQYLKDCPISGDAAAHLGETVVTVSGLKPGRYAAEVYYDQNGNNKLDRALFGVPKEGVGFSNDAKIKLAAPKWEEVVFDYDGQDRTIRLKLRYFMGPDATAK
ncbi:DUF2141 domain-containing protein [Sphingomonas glacialis]|uniref:DUF2141 domain-containing protein n=1 Tax=Sphingomonas glacialis TaxID=658225 RepID=A0A502FZD9_9SPHN|nr:DUF2141 domain-containing protein [Sphingomonas glacialis]TPG54928.1 DUF2141 domain-containing protein [Sphingomonas glacialis]